MPLSDAPCPERRGIVIFIHGLEPGSGVPTEDCNGPGRCRRIYCDTCSREHLRAIEGKLDSGWW